MFKKVWMAVMAVLAPVFAQAAVTVIDGGSADGGAARPIIRPLASLSASGDAAPVADGAESKPATEEQVWIIDPDRDKSYKDVFQKWADDSNWTLLWQLPRPYVPRNKSSFSGEFRDVFSKAIKGLGRSVGALDVKFYKANRVVTVGFLSVRPPETSYIKQGKKMVPVMTDWPVPDTTITFLDEAYVGVVADPLPAPKTSAASALASGPAAVPGVPTYASLEPIAPTKPVMPMWTVEKGAYLTDVLQAWASRAGWGYSSMLSDREDFRLGANDSYPGEFRDAVSDLVNSLPLTVKIRIQFVPDNTPPLLYVTREETK